MCAAGSCKCLKDKLIKTSWLLMDGANVPGASDHLGQTQTCDLCDEIETLETGPINLKESGSADGTVMCPFGGSESTSADCEIIRRQQT